MLNALFITFGALLYMKEKDYSRNKQKFDYEKIVSIHIGTAYFSQL